MSAGTPETNRSTETTFFINGRERERIPYGSEDEDWGADNGPCHDCGVVKGELHGLGCDVERCPECGGQAICCECTYAEDEKR